jgi:hypothetical protein
LRGGCASLPVMRLPVAVGGAGETLQLLLARGKREGVGEGGGERNTEAGLKEEPVGAAGDLGERGRESALLAVGPRGLSEVDAPRHETFSFTAQVAVIGMR